MGMSAPHPMPPPPSSQPDQKGPMARIFTVIAVCMVASVVLVAFVLARIGYPGSGFTGFSVAASTGVHWHASYSVYGGNVLVREGSHEGWGDGEVAVWCASGGQIVVVVTPMWEVGQWQSVVTAAVRIHGRVADEETGSAEMSVGATCG